MPCIRFKAYGFGRTCYKMGTLPEDLVYDTEKPKMERHDKTEFHPFIESGKTRVLQYIAGAIDKNLVMFELCKLQTLQLPLQRFLL